MLNYQQTHSQEFCFSQLFKPTNTDKDDSEQYQSKGLINGILANIPK